MRPRLALAVLGAWIGVSAAMWVVASSNFRTVDQVLKPGYRPELEHRLAPRTADQERPFLRFLAAELNRRYFRWWGNAQLALAALVLGLLFAEPGLGLGPKLLAASGSGLTAIIALVLTPAIRRLGPPLDFVPRPFVEDWKAAYAVFMRLHGAYLALDFAKVALLVAALVALLRARERPAGGDMGPGA